MLSGESENDESLTQSLSLFARSQSPCDELQSASDVTPCDELSADAGDDRRTHSRKRKMDVRVCCIHTGLRSN